MSILRSLLMLQSKLHVIGLNAQQWPFVDHPRGGGGGGVVGEGEGGGAWRHKGLFAGERRSSAQGMLPDGTDVPD